MAFNARRIDVFIVANPMKIAASDLLTMCKSRHYSDPTLSGQYQGGGYGQTVSFPHTLPGYNQDLPNFGATRLDYGIITKEFDHSSGLIDLGSRPEVSFSVDDRNGFLNPPYYGVSLDGTNSPNDTITNNALTTTARSAEMVTRYTNNQLSSNNWAASNWGEVQYTNKHFNWSTSSYVSLPSFLGAWSFVFPNYNSTRIML